MLDGKVFRATDGGSHAELGPQARLRALHREAGRDDPRERTSRDYSVDPPPDPARGSRARRLAARWIPDSLLRARVDPGRAGLLAVAMVALVVLLGVVVLVATARPTPEAAPPPLPPPPPVERTTSASPPPELVISVVGEVRRPGLVRVPEGARVADAVEAAGGAVPGTDLTSLNLARRLVDGEQLYVAVPVPPEVRQPQAAEPAGPGRKLDLNRASEAQLDELPGVGEVTAQRIVRWREKHGRFDSVDQLGEVGGIGEVRLARLRELVRV
ncbi:helix-hairpin-helix domain-containing protein [Saccharopolyspora griseoalba]|uniref:Helix-hairpin-helix domain-containing protein n=1 Tax=Saccharopolyspora griseoalba TaxID=1431848 RepID=A0ABW2LN22_9PSEU